MRSEKAKDAGGAEENNSTGTHILVYGPPTPVPSERVQQTETALVLSTGVAKKNWEKNTTDSSVCGSKIMRGLWTAKGLYHFKNLTQTTRSALFLKEFLKLYDLSLFLLFFNTSKNIKHFFFPDRRNHDTSKHLLFAQHYNKGQFAEEQGVG